MDNENLINEIIERAQSSEGEELAIKAMEHMKSLYANGTYVELKEQDIMKVLKASYIAERFFGKSRSWITHKLNHDLKNGKPDDFTPEERKMLRDALETIAFEIQSLADSMADIEE
jgi:DNA replication initiation complex subunit (GINS family)